MPTPQGRIAGHSDRVDVGSVLAFVRLCTVSLQTLAKITRHES